MIRTRLRRGTLVHLHRGVYAVGHRRLSRDGFRIAAVLAAGDGAAVSHREAAAMHGLRRASDTAPIEVSTPTKSVPIAGVRVYARRRLDPIDVTARAGVPLTTVARTLVDLADVLSADLVAKAVAAAEAIHRLDARELERAATRMHGRRGPGAARLRAALDAHRQRGTTLTRSVLEERFERVVVTAGLPAPETNAWIEGVEVDVLWRAARLVVELDGWVFHRDRVAFGRDRAKANALELAGWRVLRYTHDDVTRDARRLVRELRVALAQRGGG